MEKQDGQAMSETKHTPKPWVAIGTSVRKKGGGKISQSRPRGAAPEAWGEIEATLVADARLISAAPELLEALTRIMAELPTNLDWLDPHLEAEAKNAIAKATGGTL